MTGRIWAGMRRGLMVVTVMAGGSLVMPVGVASAAGLPPAATSPAATSTATTSTGAGMQHVAFNAGTALGGGTERVTTPTPQAQLLNSLHRRWQGWPRQISPLVGASRGLAARRQPTRVGHSQSNSIYPNSWATDSYFDRLVDLGAPDLTPGTIHAVVSRPVGLEPGSSELMTVCMPDCNAARRTDWYYPGLDGNFSVTMPAANYEVQTSLVSAAGVLNTRSQLVTVVAGNTTDIAVDFTDAGQLPTISGTLRLQTPGGVPFSPVDSSLGGGALIGVVFCPLQAGTSCTSSIRGAQGSAVGEVPATYVGNGQYSYTATLPAGDYSVFGFYMDVTNYDMKSALSAATSVVLGADPVTTSMTVTVPFLQGSVVISNSPSDVTIQPVVVECNARFVSIDNCSNNDAKNNTNTTAVVVLQPGTTVVELPDEGAVNVAPGWIYNGSLYVASSATVPISKLSRLRVGYLSPTLQGVVAGSGAGLDYVAACPAGAWKTYGCDPTSSPLTASTDAVGRWGIYAPKGNYLLFSIAALQSGPEPDFAIFLSPPVAALTGRRSTVVMADPRPSATLEGDVTTPTSDSRIIKYFVACPGGPRLDVTASLGCPTGPSETHLVQSSYTFAVWPGTWTIYGFDHNSMVVPAVTRTVTAAAGDVVRNDVSLVDPGAGVYGKVVEYNINEAFFGQSDKVVACPSSEDFSVDCPGGVVTTMGVDHPTNFWTNFRQGNGAYVLRLDPGTWNIAALLSDARSPLAYTPKTVQVSAGSVVRQDLAVTDLSANVSGNGFELPRASGIFVYEFLACPVAQVLAVDCAGGAALASSGHYSFALTPGTYNLQVRALDANGVVTVGAAVPIVVGDRPVYQDLFVTPRAVTLSGVAGVTGASAGKESLLQVTACPGTSGVTPGCVGGVSSSNQLWLGVYQGWAVSSLPGGATVGWISYAGGGSPYGSSMPYQLPLGPGHWMVAASYQDDSGQVVFGPASPVTITKAPVVANLTVAAS